MKTNYPKINVSHNHYIVIIAICVARASGSGASGKYYFKSLATEHKSGGMEGGAPTPYVGSGADTRLYRIYANT